MNREKYANNSSDGGYQKALVNVIDTSCSIMIRTPTKEWDEPPSPGIMFCQNSMQDILQIEPKNDNIKKGNTRIMHAVDTILATASDTMINENC